MKFWKISLGTTFFSKETCELMKQKGVVSLHPGKLAKEVVIKL